MVFIYAPVYRYLYVHSHWTQYGGVVWINVIDVDSTSQQRIMSSELVFLCVHTLKIAPRGFGGTLFGSSAEKVRKFSN